MADLSATIAGVRLESLFMNASGPDCTTPEQLTALARSGAGAVVTKSMTLQPRAGNEEPRYHAVPLGSINSMGLPNLGYEEYCRLAPAIKALGKPLVASVAGFSLEGYVIMARAALEAGFDLIEINLSCPNIAGHPQVGYHFETTEAVVNAVRMVCPRGLGFKLPPYFDPVHQEQVAGILKRHSVEFVTLINSVGNTLIIDPETERPIIHPRDGFGGLGGHYIKPVALANVRAFHSLLGPEVPLIGVGGVYTGTDAFEFLLAGASAVQVGTAYKQQGTAIFDRLESELNEVLTRKGYGSAAEAVGKLKPLPASAPARTG